MDNQESQFVDKCIVHFSQHFICQRERWSKCRNGRIDIVLSTANGEHFGIEAKVPDKKRGEGLGEYVKQAIRYTGYEFEVSPNHFQKIPIFICPAISYKYFLLNEREMVFEGEKWHKDRHKETDTHHSMNGFLGAFLIGEVRNVGGKDFTLMLSNKIIYDTRLGWDEVDGKWVKNKKIGLIQKNYDALIQKISK